MPVNENELRLIRASIVFSMASINSSLRAIERWLAVNPSAPERNEMSAQRLELNGEFALLDARLEALDASSNGIEAPDPARVDRIIMLSNEVRRALAQQQTASLLLSAGTNALNIAHEAALVGRA